MVRTSAQFENLSEARIEHEKLVEALDRHGREGRFMLTDLRQAVPRADPGWEALMAELRPRMTRGFRRLGALTKTAAGTIQVSRHSRQDGREMLLSDSEEQILAFFRIAAKMTR